MCADHTLESPCPQCLAAPPAFAWAVCGVDYLPPWTTVDHALKYRGHAVAAAALARWLALSLRALQPGYRPDLLVPVPLAAQRLAERGYNQAGRIAHELAGLQGWRVSELALERVRAGPALAGLGLHERRAAIHHAYVSTQRLDGLRVAVLDDVMTSGATLNDAARALREAGAHEVVALAGLRTPLRQMSAVQGVLHA